MVAPLAFWGETMCFPASERCLLLVEVGFSGLQEAMLRQILMRLTSKLVMLLWSIMFMSSIIELLSVDFFLICAPVDTVWFCIFFLIVDVRVSLDTPILIFRGLEVKN